MQSGFDAHLSLTELLVESLIFTLCSVQVDCWLLLIYMSTHEGRWSCSWILVWRLGIPLRPWRAWMLKWKGEMPELQRKSSAGKSRFSQATAYSANRLRATPEWLKFMMRRKFKTRRNILTKVECCLRESDWQENERHYWYNEINQDIAAMQILMARKLHSLHKENRRWLGWKHYVRSSSLFWHKGKVHVAQKGTENDVAAKITRAAYCKLFWNKYKQQTVASRDDLLIAALIGFDQKRLAWFWASKMVLLNVHMATINPFVHCVLLIPGRVKWGCSSPWDFNQLVRTYRLVTSNQFEFVPWWWPCPKMMGHWDSDRLSWGWSGRAYYNQLCKSYVVEPHQSHGDALLVAFQGGVELSESFILTRFYWAGIALQNIFQLVSSPHLQLGHLLSEPGFMWFLWPLSRIKPAIYCLTFAMRWKVVNNFLARPKAKNRLIPMLHLTDSLRLQMSSHLCSADVIPHALFLGDT